jgi:hypothetical protein
MIENYATNGPTDVDNLEWLLSNGTSGFDIANNWSKNGCDQVVRWLESSNVVAHSMHY